MSRGVVVVAAVVAVIAVVGGGGCATNASSDARVANNIAQATVVVGAPLAVGVALSRSHDANLRDADGRLVPVARQEGQQHLVEGAIIGGITVVVAGVLWGFMLLEDADYAAKNAPPAPPTPPPADTIGDAPPPPGAEEGVIDEQAGGIVVE